MKQVSSAVMLLLAAPALVGCMGGGGLAPTRFGTPTDLTCVPYAENVTGIVLPGDAYAWWAEAAGRYVRTHRPVPGAVLVFRATRALPLGHVAVVTAVLSGREILVEHANWLPSRITRNQPVVDVSPANDWTRVRVWYPPIGAFGTSVYRTFGFIVPAARLASRAGSLPP